MTQNSIKGFIEEISTATIEISNVRPLSQRQLNALRSLAKNKENYISSSDKGPVIVVMNKNS